LNHSQSSRGARLNYLSDATVIADTLRAYTVESLLLGNPANRSMAWAIRHRQTPIDHLILASLNAPGPVVGLLTAQDRVTDRGDPFLLLDNAMIDAAAITEREFSRMLAMMIVRIIDFRRMPTAIAARTQNPALARALRDISRRATGASFYPEPDAAAIPLATGALAYRIARSLGGPARFESTAAALRLRGSAGSAPIAHAASPCLAILDLRGVREDALVEATRQIYRTRTERPAVQPLPATQLPFPSRLFTDAMMTL